MARVRVRTPYFGSVRVTNAVSASFQIIFRPVGWLGLGLWSGPDVVGRLGSGVRVSASFQIIHRPVGRLGLGLWVG